MVFSASPAAAATLRRSSPHNNRGAAFLLAVYLSAITLLLLGGVALQRTNTELRAIQLSRDLQQSFWLAEASLDKGITTIRYGSKVDPQPQPDPITKGTMQYSIVNLDGQVLSYSKQQVTRQVKQQVTRQVTGTGTIASLRSTLSTTLQESNVLHGIWSKNLIVVSGGRNFPNVFLTGNMYSSSGSVTSTIPGDFSPLTMDGLMKLPSASSPDNSLPKKLSDWKDDVQARAPELISIKNGYMFLQGLRPCVSYPCNFESYDKMEFVQGPQSKTVSHVNGLLSVGMGISAPPFDAKVCAPTFNLAAPVMHVASGFYYRAPGTADKVRDLGHATNQVTLCLNAIAPATNQGWLNLMLDHPPELIFDDPATIYLDGSVTRDVSGLSFLLPGNPMPIPTNFVNQVFGIQNQWRVTLGAKLTSGLGPDGKPVRIDVIQVEKNVKRARDGVPPGMIWMKPGDRFSGSVYAPNSTVLVRARDCGRAPGGCGDNSFNLQYVAGNDVVVELEADHLHVGDTAADGSKLPAPTTAIKSWITQGNSGAVATN